MLNNLLGKGKASLKRDPDKIWRSRELELKGLLTFIASLDPATTRVLLLAHFVDTLLLLEQRLTAQNLDFHIYFTRFEGNRLQTSAEYQDTGYILLALVDALPESSSLPKQAVTPGGIEVHVLVAEHHPLRGVDDRILEFASHLPFASTIAFHESLDGALMQYCGGAEVLQLMTTLQIPDDESISNSMIDKSIRRAQEKIRRKVTHPITADSGEQWFQQNLSQGT